VVPLAIVRQYAVGQQIAYEVADQEVVLHYALRLLSEAGLVGRPEPGAALGALFFKGGTALRKCVFGSAGRFSQDVDLDAEHEHGFEAEIERAFAERTLFHGIAFSIPQFRYSREGNFSGTVEYEHEDGGGRFELQISYRLDPILDSRDLALQEQSYFRRVEFDPPLLHGLDPYEGPSSDRAAPSSSRRRRTMRACSPGSIEQRRISPACKRSSCSVERASTLSSWATT
jgi:predicted nucleotidyltransferase component of viral defense system